MERINLLKTEAAAEFAEGRMHEALRAYDAAAAACEALLLRPESEATVVSNEAHAVLGVVMVNQLQCLINTSMATGKHAFGLVCDDISQLLSGAYALSAADDAIVNRRRFKKRRWFIVGLDQPDECFASLRSRKASPREASDESTLRSARRAAAIHRPGIRTEMKSALFGKLFGRFAELLVMRHRQLRADDAAAAITLSSNASMIVAASEESYRLLLDAQLCLLVCAKEFGMPCRDELGTEIRRELLRLGEPSCRVLRAHKSITLCCHPRYVGHGVGMVATDAILEAGEDLLVERPTVLTTAEAADLSTYEGRFAVAVTEFVALERAALHDASAEQQLKGILGLHHPNVQKSSSVMDVLCDVWHHNSMRLTEVDFRIDEANDAQFDGSAMYLTASRLNHNCVPNALCVFKPLSALPVDAGTVTIRLLAPLEEGDEVTIAYCPTVTSKATKRSHCRFDCQCQLCQSGVLDSVVCPTSGGLIPWPPADEQSKAKEERLPDSSIATGISAVSQTVDACVNAVAACSAEGDKKGISPHLRKLLTLFTSCPLLGELHYLRFRIGLESLAAAVVASPITDQEVSEALCQLAMYLDDFCTQVMAPNWPLRTGVRMHLVFCLGRHFAGTHPADDEPCFLADPRVPPLVAASFQEHAVTSGRPSIEDFLRRYAAELQAAGVTVPEHMDMLSRLVVAQQEEACF
jgi:hypothetical protein